MTLEITIKQGKEIKTKTIINVDSYYFNKHYLEIYKDNRKCKHYFKLTTLLELEEYK